MQNKDTDIAERNDCSTGSPWDRIYLSLNSRSLSATHLVASEIASSGRTLHLQATHKSGKGAIFPSQKQCRFEYLPVKRSRSILLLFADFWYMFLVYAAPTCNVCIANYVLVWIDLRWWGDDNSKMWILLVHSHTVRSTFIIGHRPLMLQTSIHIISNSTENVIHFWSFFKSFPSMSMHIMPQMAARLWKADSSIPLFFWSLMRI